MSYAGAKPLKIKTKSKIENMLLNVNANKTNYIFKKNEPLKRLCKNYKL